MRLAKLKPRIQQQKKNAATFLTFFGGEYFGFEQFKRWTHTHFNRPTAVLSPLSFHCRPLTSNLCALHCKVEKEQRALQCGRSMPIAVLSLQCDRYRMAGGHDYSTTLSIGQ